MQEVTELGNGGKGTIDLKDLGRIMSLGSTDFFLFRVLSLVSNKSETHWKI